MRGCIVKPKGRRKSWSVKVYLGRDPRTRVKRYKWFSFPTRREAEARLSQMLAQLHGGGTIPTTKLTLAEYLEDWLKKYATSNMRETSLKSYRDIIHQHMIPAMGSIPLRRLSPLDVQGYYTAKLNGDSATKRRVLSPSTVRKHHAVLHAALEHAIQWGLLAANVCDRVKPPKNRRKEPQRWDGEQVKLFLGEAKRSSPYYPLYLTLRTTGMRPGEALGLRWQDVDLTTGAVTIRQKFYRLGGSKRDSEPTRLLFSGPKTDKGRRTVDIPPVLVDELRNLRAEQDALRKEFGPQYHDLGEHGPLIFCQPDGRPLNWENIARRDFRRICKYVGLPVIRPYEFGRHGHAAWLYEQGVHPKIISERLGHSSTAFTMDTYGGMARGLQAEVVAKLQASLCEGDTKLATLDGKQELLA
jgi:integrase